MILFKYENRNPQPKTIMQIKWNNVIVLLFVTAFCLGLYVCGPAIRQALYGLRQIGPSYGPDEQMFGLMVLGLLGVVVVAIVKILTQGK